jgi:hypothetical protein
MSLVSHIFRKKPYEPQAQAQLECAHWELAPRWESAGDIGRADRVTHYVCTNCNASISQLEAASRAS